MSEIKQLYQQLLPTGGFLLDNGNSKTEDNQFCYALSPDKGKGVFWQYFFENMFEITKQDFYFFEDFVLESPEPEFLAVQYYSSVSGEEFHPYYQLSPNSLRAYIGGSQKTYQAVYHKNVPIRSVSISIMPDFYNRYLKERLGGEYIDPRNAFKKMVLGVDFPQLVALLKQIQSYSGSGMSAKLFYEGKVLEALALIMEEAKRNQDRKKKIRITKEDEENLKAVADYLDHHYSFPVSLEQLSKFAYMGTTKLKTTFRELFGCNISDYIIRKRMEQAQHLLIGTELSIAEIAQAVGYERADSFSRQFQRTTGLLPREYRNLITKE